MFGGHWSCSRAPIGAVLARAVSNKNHRGAGVTIRWPGHSTECRLAGWHHGRSTFAYNWPQPKEVFDRLFSSRASTCGPRPIKEIHQFAC